uniref:Putative pyrroline-5-carboxylate reductase n=1 Tax=Xenopsylla cheopis TaxID=163159 RepID=A0A6M2DZ22_XENCH
MPNIPVMVGCGASVFTLGSAATEADEATTRSLMSAVGLCDVVPESLFDVVTGLSGSGPAYIFILIEALADGGVKMGLPRDLAYKLAAQTVMGAGKMVIETNQHPGKLKDDVTSPGGTTAAGLSFLETKGFRAAVQGAVEEACKRAMAVSKPS